ncbi:MAG: dCMP deaminase family protein [Lachnospiraceae bacterium]|nr:dCMP deaminase family protein [Lachnospiraceae bacterium]
MGDNMAKREGYISWDGYFMGVAHLSGMRSKDPNTQVGCCIVSNDNKILSMGYNGMPMGCSDDEFPWEREGESEELTKYPYVVHSELNAILNYRGGSLEGTKLYVSLFPCNECAKAIIQAGIRTVIYDDDKYCGTPGNIAAKRMFAAAGVKCLPYQRSGETIKITI